MKTRPTHSDQRKREKAAKKAQKKIAKIARPSSSGGAKTPKPRVYH